MDVAEVDKVGVGGGDNRENETVKKSLSKNLNGATGYLVLNARQTFT